MMAAVSSATGRLRPLTARSAILSILLGAHPPSSTGSEIVDFSRQVGINESAVRAALSRMVAAGDLVRDDGSYALSARLVERQRRQDESMRVPTAPWDGTWRVAAVVSSGKDASSRQHLRRTMLAAHFAELREGVWMRPDNLDWKPPDDIVPDLQVMTARPAGDADELVDRLFAPAAWAEVAQDLLGHVRRARTPRDRLTAFAAIVRHLTRDPQLPREVLPPDWPGGTLREAYDAFRDELLATRRVP